MKNNHIYRYERKFYIPDLMKAEVESIINLHPAIFSEIYYERPIRNIYFDSLNFNSYFDNANGTSERLKVRIRWYGEIFGNIINPKLELKIKNGLLGRKEQFSINNFQLAKDKTLLDISHLIRNSKVPEHLRIKIESLIPTILNGYIRKYYISSDKKFRITLDSDQYFYKITRLNNTFLNEQKDNNIVLELKYDEKNDNMASFITNLFPFRLTKSSKYVQAVDRLYI